MRFQLFRTVAPTESPLSLQEVAEHLRLTPLDGSPGEYQEEALLQAKLDAAVGWIDGADGWLARALIRQTWVATLPCFPAGRVIRLPLPPLISVDSIKYLDPTGAEQTWNPAVYRVVTQASPGYIVTPAGTPWPYLADEPDAVRITFTAGYGDAGDVPANIKQGLLLLVATMFENREPIAFAAQPLKLPYAVEDLLQVSQFCGTVP